MVDMKVVRVFRWPAEAHLARAKLEQEGITALVQNENYQSTDGPGYPATGVQLVVRAKDADADAALRVLESPPSEA